MGHHSSTHSSQCEGYFCFCIFKYKFHHITKLKESKEVDDEDDKNDICDFQRIFLVLKVCSLESRLGTRQLSEELQKKLCDEIGITFKTIQSERQKFAQEVVNGILKIL